MTDQTSAPPPPPIMMQMINGKLVSRCVSLAAELAIADLLREGPQDVGSTAAEVTSVQCQKQL